MQFPVGTPASPFYYLPFLGRNPCRPLFGRLTLTGIDLVYSDAGLLLSKLSMLDVYDTNRADAHVCALSVQWLVQN